MAGITGNMASIVEIPGCCGTPSPPRNSTDETTKFHFSLNVSNLDTSVAFYSVLFGVAPGWWDAASLAFVMLGLVALIVIQVRTEPSAAVARHAMGTR